MSSTLAIILFTIVATEVVVLVVYQYTAADKLRQLRYSCGLEELKIKKKIESLKNSIQSYHDKLDKVRTDIDEYESGQYS